MRTRSSVLTATLSSLALLACGDSPTAPASGPPARMLALDGAIQSGLFGQPTSITPAVLVTDLDNRPVSGVAVTFFVQPGGGSITASNPITDAKGVATPGTWTLGSTFGAKTLTATTAGLPPVTFVATALAPDAGILAFNLTDAAADTLGTTAVGVPKAHDLLSVRGDFKRDSLIVTLTFGAPVGPSSAGGTAALGGFVEFDIDDNLSTGRAPASNTFGASATIGVDYVVILSSTGTTVSVISTIGAPTTAVPASFSGTTLVMRIPLRALGDDDGNFTIVGVIGTIDRPTDVFPNSGASTIRPAGGLPAPSVRSQRLPKAPSSINGSRLRWGPTTP